MSSISPHLARNLNPRQLEAVTHFEGPLLVLAGAGSGKTRVITYRIVHLVHDCGVPGSGILAVTFTNKAAGEMKERVRKLLGGSSVVPWIATFHSTGARLLRRFAAEAGLDPRFVIYDDTDQVSMVRKCLQEMNLDDKVFAPRAVASEIERQKQRLVGPSEYKNALSTWHQQFGEVYKLYERRMADSGALDFGDLIYRFVRLLRERPDIAASLRDRFRWVLVDEFQDTNYVQYEMTRLLAGDRPNLCVVGDDDQSIYTWRGAEPKYILDFERDFPGTRVVTLEQNYRSTATILKAAGEVIKENLKRHPKTLWTENPRGALIAYFEAEDDRHEAETVIGKVKEHTAKGGSLRDLAVFYRVNAQSRVLEEACLGNEIPYKVVGAMRFYDRAEVKDLLAYLRIVQNPDDYVNFVRIVNNPARGIGPLSQDRILARAARDGTGPYEALGAMANDESVATGLRKKLREFKTLWDGWRAFKDEGAELADLAARILEESGYQAALKAQDTIEAEGRLENLGELMEAMREFESEEEDEEDGEDEGEEEEQEPSLAAFLDYVTLHTSEEEVKEGDYLTLMTAHMAKGLEFQVVFVVGLEEGLFPHWRKDLLESPEEIEEDRRLCYVAMTRARERLYLSSAVTRRLFGSFRMNPPSRFLRSIPAELVEVLNVERYDRSRDLEVHDEDDAPSVKRRPPTGKKAEKAPEPAPEIDGWKSGTKVRHKKFGLGMVVGVDQGKDHVKLKVAFPGYGIKTLLAEFLERV